MKWFYWLKNFIKCFFAVCTAHSGVHRVLMLFSLMQNVCFICGMSAGFGRESGELSGGRRPLWCHYRSAHFTVYASSLIPTGNDYNNNNNSRIWAAESARSRGIHGKRPISSSILQSPHNASTLFCFETLSLPMSPRTI